MFAECTADGHVRGLARWGNGAEASALRPDELPGAVLAITIERQEPDNDNFFVEGSGSIDASKTPVVITIIWPRTKIPVLAC